MAEWNEDDLSTYSDFSHPSFAETVKTLLANGTDPNIKDDELEATPLIKTSITVTEYSLNVAKILLEAGADVNLTNKYGVTALHQLISHHKPGHFSYDNQLARAQFLIDHGAEINTYAEMSCNTPLHLATYKNCKDMVVLLLKNGADKDVKDSEGKTAREVAVEEGFEEIANLF
jgi:uncharacterized protein